MTAQHPRRGHETPHLSNSQYRQGAAPTEPAGGSACRPVAVTAAGVGTMTAVYVAMAATSWAVPTLFQSANGTNGVAGDDILTGVLVMGGGSWRALSSPVYWIEMHETFFGKDSATAKGAANDAIFTWLHQDVGLVLVPRTRCRLSLIHI